MSVHVPNDNLLPLLSATLTRLLGKSGRSIKVEDDTDLIERGVLDFSGAARPDIGGRKSFRSYV